MRLAQGRAGWALLAAGTVGLSVCTAAPSLPSAAPIPVAKTEVSADAVDPLGRLAAIKVELAWLTDPTTFPYALAAFVNNGHVEVAGIVPSDWVRQRALQLANDLARLPVQDKLLVAPGASVVPVKDARADLSQTAANSLSKWFNQFPGNFEVSANAAGEITVKGQVPTCEDKLTISRRLGQLTGCTAVVNHLEVAKVTRDGKLCTPISADGKLVVTGDPKTVVPQLTPDSLPRPVAFQSQATAVRATTPSMNLTVAAASKSAPAAAPASPYGGAIAAMVPSTTSVATPPRPLSTAVTNNATAAVQKPASKPTAAPSGVVQTAATQPADASAHGGLFGAVFTTSSAKPATDTVVHASTPTAPAKATATPVPSKPTTEAAAATPPAPKATKPATDAAVRTPTAPVAATLAKPTPPPAKPVATVEKPKNVKKSGLTPEAAAAIQQHVATACGGKARNVAVKVTGDKDLALSFCVKSEADGQALGRMVMNLPELMPYKVDLQVDVK